MADKELEIDLGSILGNSSKTEDSFIITDNILYLNGEVTPRSTEDILVYITQSNFMVPEEKPKVINLLVQSPGGCLDSTLALISGMRASSIPIRTVALGTCASGGLMICLSGHMRLIDKYCSVMSHTLSTGYQGYAKPADLKRWFNEVKRARDRMVDLYHEHTGLDIKYIKKNLLPKNGDIYMSATEAIEHKLFDDYFTGYNQLNDPE